MAAMPCELDPAETTAACLQDLHLTTALGLAAKEKLITF